MIQLKILCFFNSMPYGMSKIQKCSVSLFGRIFFYHHFFNITASYEHFLKNLDITFTDFIHIFNEPLIKHAVLYQSMFHYLRKAGKILSFIQSCQCTQIHVNKDWHFKCTNHILITVKIHSGLSAYAGISLRKQCCGYLDKIHSS